MQTKVAVCLVLRALMSTAYTQLLHHAAYRIYEWQQD